MNFSINHGDFVPVFSTPPVIVAQKLLFAAARGGGAAVNNPLVCLSSRDLLSVDNRNSCKLEKIDKHGQITA